MGIGVSFRLAPGVRIRATSRGLRASVGPRSARLHVGAGRTTVSSGLGPMTVWTPLAGRTRPTAARRPTVAQQQAQARAADRARQVQAVRRVEDALTGLHRQAFAAAGRPVLPPVAGADPRRVASVRKAMRARRRAGIAFWRLAERRAAARAAEVEAQTELDRQRTGAVVLGQYRQALAEEHWQRLAGHHPLTVVQTLDDAFADNASDSLCVDAGHDPVTGRRWVTVVIHIGGLDLVPEHRPDTTPAGRPTLRRRTQTDRNHLYLRALASTVAATAKEAFAVAPAADDVRVLVVRGVDGDSGREAVYAGTLRREALAGLDWASIDPLEPVLAADGAQLNRQGRTREVTALSVDPAGTTGGLLQALAQAPAD